MVHIIAFAGQKNAGKTTCANFLPVTKLSFARPLKEITKLLFAMSDEQMTDPIVKEQMDQRYHMSPRQILQTLGETLREYGTIHFNRTIWLIIMEQKLSSLPKDTYVVIDDVRYEDEVDLIRKFGGIVVYVQRSPVNRDQHSSEQFNPSWADYAIDNNGTTAELHDKVKKIIENEYPTSSKYLQRWYYPTKWLTEISTVARQLMPGLLLGVVSYSFLRRWGGQSR